LRRLSAPNPTMPETNSKPPAGSGTGEIAVSIRKDTVADAAVGLPTRKAIVSDVKAVVTLRGSRVSKDNPVTPLRPEKTNKSGLGLATLSKIKETVSPEKSISRSEPRVNSTPAPTTALPGVMERETESQSAVSAATVPVKVESVHAEMVVPSREDACANVPKLHKATLAAAIFEKSGFIVIF